jgi:hypothetical protein
LAHKPAEVGLHDEKFAALGVDAHGFAVGFAVAPKPCLVGFEHGHGDFVGAGDAAFERPAEEAFEGLFAAFDGGGRVVAGCEVMEVGAGVVDEVGGIGVLGQGLVADAAVAIGAFLNAAAEGFGALDAGFAVSTALALAGLLGWLRGFWVVGVHLGLGLGWWFFRGS